MPHPNSWFRFGVFELDGRTGEMRKNGRAGPRLVGQPLELLLHLLDRPGELVSREELRQRLWPADTFVDYDHSLNAAVNKVREALSDAADSPRFIQTVPRRGYRFIAPVDRGETGPSASAISPGSIPALDVPALDALHAAVQPIAGRSTLLSDARELPEIGERYSRLLFAVLQAMYLSFYVLAMAHLSGVDAALAVLSPGRTWVFVLVIVTASAGIPIRLYFLSAAVFGYRGLTSRFGMLFPVLFFLDELWSLAPFLLVNRIGWGLAVAATACLVFLPFSQRSVLLMGDGAASHDSNR